MKSTERFQERFHLKILKRIYQRVYFLRDRKTFKKKGFLSLQIKTLWLSKRNINLLVIKTKNLGIFEKLIFLNSKLKI